MTVQTNAPDHCLGPTRVLMQSVEKTADRRIVHGTWQGTLFCCVFFFLFISGSSPSHRPSLGGSTAQFTITTIPPRRNQYEIYGGNFWPQKNGRGWEGGEACGAQPPARSLPSTARRSQTTYPDSGTPAACWSTRLPSLSIHARASLKQGVDRSKMKNEQNTAQP